MRNPYDIIIRKVMTEKSVQLASLPDNPNLPKRYLAKSRQIVFLVDSKADKIEIRRAVEQIYADRGIQVQAVNTLNVKPKTVRVRGRYGVRSGYKKAIVTLRPGQNIDESSI